MVSDAPRTIGDCVREAAETLAAARIERADREAEMLIAHALNIDRAALIAHPDRPVSAEAAAAIRKLTARRAEREPLPYVLGQWEFYGLTLRVTRDVMIPRPETEALVETAVALLREKNGGSLLDLGTGCGAIALAVASRVPDASIVATDISRAALDVARANARLLGLADRIRFAEGDLWEPLSESGARNGCPQTFDCIVSNPPYIRSGDFGGLEPEVAEYEPRIALDGGEDGLSVTRRIVAGAGAHLAAEGALVLEVGANQAADVATLCDEAGLCRLRIVKDLAGLDRVVVGHRCG